MVFLAEELKGVLHQDSLFEDACRLHGEVFRELEARRTLRFELGEKAYFLKLHFGVGWREIFKNLLQLKLPVLGAKNEWLAVNRLKTLDIDTLTPIAYVSEGINPANIRSCIVTAALDNTESLEALAQKHMISLSLKRMLIDKIAAVSRRMHSKGINHRDFYLCHFLIDLDCLHFQLDSNKYIVAEGHNLKISLIDLHRAQIRSRTPRRWKIKDISGLLFSAANANLSKYDVLRFIKLYTGKPLRYTLKEDRTFWISVVQRAQKLYIKDHHRPSELLATLLER